MMENIINYPTPKEYLKNTDKRVIQKLKTYLPESLHKHGPKFILYLINSPKQMSVLLKKFRYSVPLPSRFVQSHNDALYKMKNNGIPLLVELGIISRSNYKRANENDAGLCREYGVSPTIGLELMLYSYELGITLHSEGNRNKQRNDPWILKNPVTNQEAFASVASNSSSSVLSSVILNPLSPLYSVMKHVFKDVISIKDIEEYCVNRYKSLLLRKDKLMLKNPRRYYSEERSIYSDWCKYISLILRGNTDKATGVFKYNRNFIVTSTGRLCEVNGGLQGLSRGCKSYIYKDIENLNNYDFVSSQLVLLKHFADKMNINTKWISNYMNIENAKHVYAKKIGISVDAWKKTILSMVFGGIDNRYGTPYQTILKDKGGNKQVAEYHFKIWQNVTEDLRSICKLWLSKIHKFAKANADKNDVLENAVGIRINIKDLGVNRKFLSSFLLQGLESKILSDLVLYSNKIYEVVSIEFDGLVIIGEITDDVWKDVLTKNKLENSSLKIEKKNFA